MTIVDIPFNGCPNRDKRYRIAGNRIRPTRQELVWFWRSEGDQVTKDDLKELLFGTVDKVSLQAFLPSSYS